VWDSYRGYRDIRVEYKGGGVMYNEISRLNVFG